MKLVPSDPDIETLVKRIERKDLDLQPDFQRGEVWSIYKRQKLIDSILRGWHVPPIHVVESDERDIQEVLDGQQRLRSIYDFATNRFSVDGSIEPTDPRIESMGGLRYSNLPAAVKRAFNNFTIRQFTITDYSPQEPAELFYRLNQPVVLTAAETRNAFIGETRSQVRRLARLMESQGYSRDTLGFSNARMAYDDVISRLCLAFERRTIATLITASDLAQRYRSGEPFPGRVVGAVEEVILVFARAINGPFQIRLNKAGLFSWLWFIQELLEWFGSLGDSEIPQLIFSFEEQRETVGRVLHFKERFDEDYDDPLMAILGLYNDLATSRVANVASVVGRHLALWAFRIHHASPDPSPTLSARQRTASLQTLTLATSMLIAKSAIEQTRIIDEYIRGSRESGQAQ